MCFDQASASAVAVAVAAAAAAAVGARPGNADPSPEADRDTSDASPDLNRYKREIYCICKSKDIKLYIKVHGYQNTYVLGSTMRGW